MIIVISLIGNYGYFRYIIYYNEKNQHLLGFVNGSFFPPELWR